MVPKTAGVRVLVVDDAAESRQAVAAVVAAADGFDLAGCVGSGREALDRLQGFRPDLVLLDVRMPELNGYETARLILESEPTTIVVLVSATEASTHGSGEVDSCGAAAFVRKDELTPRRLAEVWQGCARPAGAPQAENGAPARPPG